MKYVSEKEFKAAASGEAIPADVALRKQYTAEVKDLGENKSRFTITTQTVDRHGDTVAAAGWQTANFMKNPVVLFAHDYDAPPVAKCLSLASENGKLVADVEWMQEGLYPFGDTIRGMVKEGFLSAVSVGFIALDWQHPGKDQAEADGRSEWDYDFTKQELLEFSIVPVPANPECLVVARSIVAAGAEETKEVKVETKNDDGTMMERMSALEKNHGKLADDHKALGERVNALEECVGKMAAPAVTKADIAAENYGVGAEGVKIGAVVEVKAEDEVSEEDLIQLVEAALEQADYELLGRVPN